MSRTKLRSQRITAKTPPPATNGNGNGHAPTGKLIASATSSGLIEITNRDRQLFQLWGELAPSQVMGILRQALIGSLVWQERLFELMVDSWPRLQKNIESLKNDVADLDWSIEPYAEKDTEPTASAQDKAQLVERALAGMEADLTRDTSDFSGLVKDIIDATLCGFSISEIYWTSVDGEVVPQYTKKIPARFYGYSMSPDQPDQLMLNPQGNLSFTWDNLQQFPADKFLVGVYKSNLSHPTIGAKLRCLTPYWLAQKYGLKWFMNFCQVFGSPFRMAEYTPGNDANSQSVFQQLCSMLETMGNTGWGAFPAGSKVEFMESKTGNGTMLPQRVLVGDANEECDLTILGQVLTSTSGRAGGNRALGEIHADTERKVLNGTAKFVKRVLNQLIRSIVFLNYGETSELPTAKGADEEEQDELAIAQTAAIKYGSDLGQLAIPVSMDALCGELGITQPDQGAKLYIPKSAGSDPIFPEPPPPPVNPLLALPPGNNPESPKVKPGDPAALPKGGATKATASDAGMIQPSTEMVAAVQHGLDLRKKLGRGGSLSAVTRARDIGSGKPVSVSTAKRMLVYFDAFPEDGNADPESAAGVAYLLHGGSAGKAWCEGVCGSIAEAQYLETGDGLIEAYNPYHDERGRFATGPSAESRALRDKAGVKFKDGKQGDHHLHTLTFDKSAKVSELLEKHGISPAFVVRTGDQKTVHIIDDPNSEKSSKQGIKNLLKDDRSQTGLIDYKRAHGEFIGAKPKEAPTEVKPETPTAQPVSTAKGPKKYRVETKPIRKYAPLFESDSLEEVSNWMDKNLKWLPTSSEFERRKSAWGDVVVTTPKVRGDLMDEHGNAPTAYSEAEEAYHLQTRRRTPPK
jgi:phage gp29-like protein